MCRKRGLLRLGILGGTFDPIHLGHLCLAEDVGDELGLESLYLIPAALPPHKEKRSISPFHHRLEMTRLAAGESPLFEAFDLEGRRGGISFSIETLREFHKLFQPKLELFFIIGTDAFLQIETWKEYQRLFDYAHFVVIERPGVESERLEPFLNTIGLGFEKKEGKGMTYVAPSGNLLIYKIATLMDISSTSIRERVAEGRSIRFLVPESISEYILEKGLYKVHGDS